MVGWGSVGADFVAPAKVSRKFFDGPVASAKRELEARRGRSPHNERAGVGTRPGAETRSAGVVAAAGAGQRLGRAGGRRSCLRPPARPTPWTLPSEQPREAPRSRPLCDVPRRAGVGLRVVWRAAEVLTSGACTRPYVVLVRLRVRAGPGAGFWFRVLEDTVPNHLPPSCGG